MGLINDLTTAVTDILATRWVSRDGRVVPSAEDVKLGNNAVRLDGTVLYADLADSTGLVKQKSAAYAAEVYKCYLHCASKIIVHYGGVITAFDGDRVMAVYIGDRKNSDAARTSLAINHAVLKIINPKIEAQYPGKGYIVRQSIGIDTGSLFIAKTGIRGSNDLVWVGTAANLAAKLCALRVDNYASWITNRVYDRLRQDVKMSGEKNMWEKLSWTAQDGMTIYRSNYHLAAT
jgi:class 3 adenylate cyclase